MPSIKNSARELQFGRRILIVGIFVMSIIWGINAQAPKAPVPGCQLLMCTQPDGKVAVAAIDDPNDVPNAQNFIAGQCPGETNITKCDIDCNGPYNPGVLMAYWTWKGCIVNLVGGNAIWDFVCDKSVLSVCQLGQDPDYPFNN